ncbi:HAD family hydrolase [Jannaschia marina]|uniref:HAD family hydrolase n=1 Tax=Jannaschia marina TaxID=2741674 RepID=UPI0015CBDF85|nr:HAD-IA family hydrolase [Jannaschia marina]
MREAGLLTAVCSNLASPYGPALRRVLPSPADVEVLSYEVGAIKPEPAIYKRVLQELDLPATDVLFVGDTPSADVDGPRAAGFSAMLVEDFERLFSLSGI